MDEKERSELVSDLMRALEERGAPEALSLLDLIRAEQGLIDTLAVIRREIDLIVRSQRPPRDV